MTLPLLLRDMFGAVSCFLFPFIMQVGKAKLFLHCCPFIFLFQMFYIWIQQHHFQHPLRLGLTWIPQFCTLVTSGANYGNQSPHWVLSCYRLACYQSNTQQGAATSLQVPATCWQPQTYSVCSVVSSHLPVGSKMLGRSLGLRPP